jgi:DNA anti-recombination protein RmuC
MLQELDTGFQARLEAELRSKEAENRKLREELRRVQLRAGQVSQEYIFCYSGTFE